MIPLLVFLGGGLGSVARYLVSITFPHGTVIVNVLGCYVLGAVVQLGIAGHWTTELRAAIAVGFLGGFTTYSSFNQETMVMFMNGAAGAAVTNIAVTLLGGLAAGGLGLLTARLVTG